jgi:hypothetical protein
MLAQNIVRRVRTTEVEVELRPLGGDSFKERWTTS